MYNRHSIESMGGDVMEFVNMDFKKIFSQLVKTLAEQEDIKIEFEFSEREAESGDNAAM